MSEAADPQILLSAIDTLHAAGSTWRKDPAGRAAMTLACHDADYLPRVKDAGTSKKVKGVTVQVMHNGLLVKQAGYQGQWEAQIIEGLKGVHEPQEEKVFHEVLKRMKPGGTMMELGSWWCYYSMWFLRSVKNAKAICCEPDPDNIKLGQFNMSLNGFKQGKDVVFYEAAAGANDKQMLHFTKEDGGKTDVQIRTVDALVQERSLKRLDILHIDIQGAELEALRGAQESINAGIVRFVFISTHHYAISGDPRLHQKCLEFISQNGGSIVAEHSVLESCSGDGLIVASFKAEDKDFHVEISRQPVNDSLFRSSDDDVAILWEAHNQLLAKLIEHSSGQEKLEARHKQEIDTKNAYISQLENTLNEITPLRRHVKRFLRYRLGVIDRGLANAVTRKHKFKPAKISDVDSAKTPQELVGRANSSDGQNFKAYNKRPSQPVLPVYKISRKAVRKSLNQLRKIKRRSA